MLVPAIKLHPASHTASFSWAVHMHNRILSRSLPAHGRTLVCCNATASASSSFDEPYTSLALSKAELESCQWLKPSEKASTNERLDHRVSSPSPSASHECCFSAVAAPSPTNGYAQSSNGSSLQSPNGSSTQTSHASHHASPPKHSSILLNALPATGLLDLAFPQAWIERAENGIERAIFDFRFLSLLAVAGSLAGSFLCFLKGCVFIVESYGAFYAMCIRGEHTGKMVLRLVEAVDVYLTGTVMLIFGMGLYGLFISNVATNLPPHQDRALQNSSLFGMFLLQERPKWMRIASLDELKTKLGHVVVMILLVKMFERSKAVAIVTGVDLLSYSISIFLTSAALLVLRHLHH